MARRGRLGAGHGRRAALPAVAGQRDTGQQRQLPAGQRAEPARREPVRTVRQQQSGSGAGAGGRQPGADNRGRCGVPEHPPAGSAVGAHRGEGERPGPVTRRPGRAAARAVQRRPGRPGRHHEAGRQPAQRDQARRATGRPAGASGRRGRGPGRPAEENGDHGQPGRGPHDHLHPGPAAADLPFAAGAADHDHSRDHGGGDFRATGRRGGDRRPESLTDRPAHAHCAGAGGRHRLRLVPGLPGPGGAADRDRAQGGGAARADPGRRIDHLLRRDRHRGAAVPAGRHVPDLFSARHSAGDRDRRDAAGRADPAAGVAGHLRPRRVLAVHHPRGGRERSASGVAWPRESSGVPPPRCFPA